jgi:hypothetical protein
MRLYKKEKPKPIKEQDKDTIVNFISEYFPLVEERIEKPQSAASYSKEKFLSSAETGTGTKMQSFCKLKLMQAGISDPFNVVQRDKPFMIQVGIDLTDVEIEGIAKDTQLDYKTFIYCKHLSGKPSKCIAEISGETRNSKVFTEIVEPEPLPAGTYRLEVDTTVSTSAKKAKALLSLRDEHILHVY